MKAIILISVLFCTKSGFAQTNKLIGAWFGSDARTETSLIFKTDTKVLIRTGPKGRTDLSESFKEGVYSFKGNQLLIAWGDGEKQHAVLKFK